MSSSLLAKNICIIKSFVMLYSYNIWLYWNIVLLTLFIYTYLNIKYMYTYKKWRAASFNTNKNV